MEVVKLIMKILQMTATVGEIYEGLKSAGKLVGDIKDFLNKINERIDRQIDAKLTEKMGEIIKKYEEERVDVELPEDIKEALREICEQYLSEQRNYVYIDGVSLISDLPLGSEEQGGIEAVLTYSNFDNENEELEEWEEPYQNTVDEFKLKYTGSNLYKGNDGFIIGENMLSINFDPEGALGGLGIAYNEADIRELANALNSLLGDRYFTRYIVYGRDMFE